ncbi:Hypothetical predicted protein [Marmota monax]|uniref:Uncharacterized protein n=1 Tax=Marmota monax TaxID=9995 RepID=A0A5E4C769_MARMO|nr:hypothetical protein GHT09_001355 [Marmota monax]VTJ77747.1 Hypothetical predicted protein [Marmota monax]
MSLNSAGAQYVRAVVITVITTITVTITTIIATITIITIITTITTTITIIPMATMDCILWSPSLEQQAPSSPPSPPSPSLPQIITIPTTITIIIITIIIIFTITTTFTITIIITIITNIITINHHHYHHHHHHHPSGHYGLHPLESQLGAPSTTITITTIITTITITTIAITITITTIITTITTTIITITTTIITITIATIIATTFDCYYPEHTSAFQSPPVSSSQKLHPGVLGVGAASPDGAAPPEVVREPQRTPCSPWGCPGVGWAPTIPILQTPQAAPIGPGGSCRQTRCQEPGEDAAQGGLAGHLAPLAMPTLPRGSQVVLEQGD